MESQACKNSTHLDVKECEEVLEEDKEHFKTNFRYCIIALKRMLYFL
jgi:hypothetical protein